jgi:hypothetical protein
MAKPALAILDYWSFVQRPWKTDLQERKLTSSFFFFPLPPTFTRLAAATGTTDGYRAKGNVSGPGSSHKDYTATLDPGKQLGTTQSLSDRFVV